MHYRSSVIGLTAAALLTLSPAAAATVGPKSRFLDACVARLHKGDLTVAKDCYTEDFVSRSPEAKLLAPQGELRGRAALEAAGQGAGFDAAHWTINLKLIDEIESDTMLWRHVEWVGRNPKGSYLGFDGLPADMVVKMTLMFKYVFRDGKIAEEVYTYDSFGPMVDMAQGDFALAASKMLALAPMIEQMRAAARAGKPPVPPSK